MATKPKTRKAAANVADPIFAAIAEHKAKEKEWLRLSAVLDAAEGEACKTHGKRPLSVTQQFNTTTIPSRRGAL
jgi:hypothetical protein